MTRPDNEPARLRSVAENLAAEAAAFVRGRRAEVFGISRAGDGDGAVRAKSSPTDPVTVVDTDTERLLRDRLAQLRPGDPILGEEGGGPADVTATPSDRVTWVLDPIDGTVNFVYGIPAYAVSIGAQVGGITVAGAVADVAARTVYSAATGLGAHLTDERGRHVLRCTGVDELSMALLGTGFGYSVRCREKQAELLAHVVPLVRDVRRIGSAALDLCMVAAGRLDCQGQIRFGTAGQATAAALWLVAPCTELYHDSRADDSVDLALGTDFTTLAHNDDSGSGVASPKGPSVLVESGTLGDLCDHTCTLIR